MTVFLLDAITRLISMLPHRVALKMGRGIGWFFGSVVRYHRRDALEALEKSLPELTPAERVGVVNRMYANLGMNGVESILFTRGANFIPDSMVRIEGEEHVRDALLGGKGALILTAHFGNWDVLSIVTTRHGYALTIISKDLKNKSVNEYWMRMRAKHGMKIVPAHQSYRACRSALKKNELVGFILDQNMIRDEGIFVDFFWRPACTTPGLAYMAAQSGAPVVPAFIRRLDNGGHHAITLYPPLPPPPDRSPESILAATQEYTHIIEREIRAYPEQWIWIHRRWRTKPSAQ